MNHLLEQPKLWQKHHQCVVSVYQVIWRNGNIETMIVKYPEERFGGQVITYYSDENADYSLTHYGDPVFTAVKL